MANLKDLESMQIAVFELNNQMKSTARNLDVLARTEASVQIATKWIRGLMLVSHGVGEVQVRAEHLAGILLCDANLCGGDRKKRRIGRNGTKPVLADLRLDPGTSKKLRRFAKFNLGTIESVLTEMQDDGIIPTANGVMRRADSRSTSR